MQSGRYSSVSESTGNSFWEYEVFFYSFVTSILTFVPKLFEAMQHTSTLRFAFLSCTWNFEIMGTGKNIALFDPCKQSTTVVVMLVQPCMLEKLNDSRKVSAWILQIQCFCSIVHYQNILWCSAKQRNLWLWRVQSDTLLNLISYCGCNEDFTTALVLLVVAGFSKPSNRPQ